MSIHAIKAGHTPGPWRLAGTEIWAGPKRIAFGKGAYDEKDRAIQKANARLIAADPDLLEALEKADQTFISWQVGQIPGRPEDILAVIEMVRAALAKAKGGV